MHDEVSSQVTLAAMVVMLVQYLKSSGWAPWITAQTDKLNKAVSAFLAALSAAAIFVSYDSAAHVLTISGLTLANGLHFVWHWAQSFAYQQVIYHGAIKKDAAAH